MKEIYEMLNDCKTEFSSLEKVELTDAEKRAIKSQIKGEHSNMRKNIKRAGTLACATAACATILFATPVKEVAKAAVNNIVDYFQGNSKEDIKETVNQEILPAATKLAEDSNAKTTAQAKMELLYVQQVDNELTIRYKIQFTDEMTEFVDNYNKAMGLAENDSQYSIIYGDIFKDAKVSLGGEEVEFPLGFISYKDERALAGWMPGCTQDENGTITSYFYENSAGEREYVDYLPGFEEESEPEESTVYVNGHYFNYVSSVAEEDGNGNVVNYFVDKDGNREYVESFRDVEYIEQDTLSEYGLVNDISVTGTEIVQEIQIRLTERGKEEAFPISFECSSIQIEDQNFNGPWTFTYDWDPTKYENGLERTPLDLPTVKTLGGSAININAYSATNTGLRLFATYELGDKEFYKDMLPILYFEATDELGNFYLFYPIYNGEELKFSVYSEDLSRGNLPELDPSATTLKLKLFQEAYTDETLEEALPDQCISDEFTIRLK